VADGVPVQANVHRPSIDKAIVSGYLLPDYCRDASPAHHAAHRVDGAFHVNLTRHSDDDGSSELSPVGDRGSRVHYGLCVNPDFEAGMLTFGQEDLKQVRACADIVLG
jgi:hypothetical protein